MDPKMACLVLLASFLLFSTSSASTKLEESDMEIIAAEAPVIAPPPTLAPHIPVDREKECPGLCKARCSAASRQNMCNRACNSCCKECGCVPPGTYGNREMCGKCYTGRLGRHNQPKCP